MFLGKFLKDKRATKGWTQDEISGKLGIARTTYANYEQNRSHIDASLISKISSLFQMPADEIRSFAEVKTGEFQEDFTQYGNTIVSKDIWQAKLQECIDLRERVKELNEMVSTQKELLEMQKLSIEQLKIQPSKNTSNPVEKNG